MGQLVEHISDKVNILPKLTENQAQDSTVATNRVTKVI